MALATRCPNCQAMFRVVSDQLKLRGGLVRCGSCRHVFDAIGSLSYIEESALTTAAEPAAAPAPAPAPEAAAPAAASASARMAAAATPRAPQQFESRPEPGEAPPAAASPRSTGGSSTEALAPRERTRLPEAIGAVVPTPVRREETSPAAPDPLAVPTLLARDADAADEAKAEQSSDALRADTTARETAASPEAVDTSASGATREERRRGRAAAPSIEDVAQDEDAADEAEVSFLKDTRPTRGFSITYGGGSMVLALVLLLQSAVLFRTELLTRWPELRPRLVDICEIYGCTVGWPTRPELLAVVGTELQAVPGTDILELTAVIRNRAAFRMALPAVEVTLTDTTNRTLARKVFAPVDYLASNGEPSSRINEGLGPGSDYIVRITFEARGLNAAGFVVYPFYL